MVCSAYGFRALQSSAFGRQVASLRSAIAKLPISHRKETREWNRHSLQSKPHLILCFQPRPSLMALRMTLPPQSSAANSSRRSMVGPGSAPAEPRFGRQMSPKETICPHSMRTLRPHRHLWAPQTHGSRQLTMRVPQMSSCLKRTSLDKEAFAELCSRHVKSVQRKVFGIVRNHEDTEDVVQEALLKAYTHLSGFRGSCTFSTWLMSIAINSALMLLRKRKGHSEVSFDYSVDDDQTWSSWEFADPHLDTERSYARRQALRVLSGAVVRLPSRYRSVLERYHAREQSMKESADTLDSLWLRSKVVFCVADSTFVPVLQGKASPLQTHISNHQP